MAYNSGMVTHLSVNLNKIALLRNQRDYGIPSVLAAGKVCLDAGAAGLTVHPRPDERHIRPHDVHELATLLKDYPGREFNIEGNPFEPPFMDLVAAVRPNQATLVPDSPDQRTSDRGWMMPDDIERLIPIVKTLQSQGVRVSLFMEPDAGAFAFVPDTGADRIELRTEPYARAFRHGQTQTEMPRYLEAARQAQALGLGLNAGHDLNLKNLGPFCRAVREALGAVTIKKPARQGKAVEAGILEVSIGHELTADALFVGLGQTVKDYLAALAEG